MRIVYRTPGFPPDIGGIETLAGEILPALRARGHEFLVIAGGPSAVRAADGAIPDIPVHRLPFTSALMARDIQRIAALRTRARQLELEFEPDLVHLNYGGADAFFHVAPRRQP